MAATPTPDDGRQAGYYKVQLYGRMLGETVRLIRRMERDRKVHRAAAAVWLVGAVLAGVACWHAQHAGLGLLLLLMTVGQVVMFVILLRALAQDRRSLRGQYRIRGNRLHALNLAVAEVDLPKEQP